MAITHFEIDIWCYFLNSKWVILMKFFLILIPAISIPYSLKYDFVKIESVELLSF